MKTTSSEFQKQPPRGVLRKRCSENMQQIYRRTSMPKCDFNKVASNFIEIAVRHECSPINFKTLFPKNTSGRLLLEFSNIYFNFLILFSDMSHKHSLYNKWIFPLRISSVNLIKSAGKCGFAHIYWRTP